LIVKKSNLTTEAPLESRTNSKIKKKGAAEPHFSAEAKLTASKRRNKRPDPAKFRIASTRK